MDPDRVPPGPKITEDQCFSHFQRFLRKKGGLRVFYSDEDLKKLAPAAKQMVLAMVARGCLLEIALQLSILILYDIVILLGLKLWSNYTSDA